MMTLATTLYADRVMVGNVAAGKGSIAITDTRTGNDALSSVFAGDTARITFTFTATGSMNAYGDDDTPSHNKRITLPSWITSPDSQCRLIPRYQHTLLVERLVC